MALLQRQTFDIPITEFEGLDDMFFKLIEMKKEKALKRFSAQYEETRQRIFDSVTVRGICDSFAVDTISEESIRLVDGTTIRSEMLSHLFSGAEEIVFAAITVLSYDELAESESDNLKQLFYDGWGSAIADCGHTWLRNKIKNQLSDTGASVSFPWSPGQHEVDIKLQRELFALLRPEDIGITLSPSLMMHSQKSVSSFIGIGRDVEESLRACDFCRLRETCPAAYA